MDKFAYGGLGKKNRMSRTKDQFAELLKEPKDADESGMFLFSNMDDDTTNN